MLKGVRNGCCLISFLVGNDKKALGAALPQPDVTILHWPLTYTHRTFKGLSGDFPGSPVVKNPAYQCRRHGFNPQSRKIVHALEQQSLCTPATKPVL